MRALNRDALGLIQLLSVYSLKAMFGRSVYLHTSCPVDVNLERSHIVPERLCLYHSLLVVVELDFFYPDNISFAVYRS